MLPDWKSHQISCCHGHEGPLQGAGSPWGPSCVPRLLEHPWSHSRWMQTLTQGEQRPLRGTGTQTLCPKDKDQCLGKQSSEKSLLNTFHCRNNRAGSDPGCPRRADRKQNSHLPPAAPCPLPCQHGTGGKVTAQGSHGLSKWGLQAPVHTGTAPHLMLWLEAEQEHLAPLNQPLQGWFWGFFASSRNKSTPFMQAPAGSCFPTYQAGHRRIRQPN